VRKRNSNNHNNEGKHMAVVQIWVKLDKTSDTAKVILESRDKKVPSGDKIKWHKKDQDDDSDIVELDPGDNESVFPNRVPGRNGNKLTCDFEPGDAPPDTEFDYTLYVESDGDRYDTTDPSVQAEDGKPVIRN